MTSPFDTVDLTEPIESSEWQMIADHLNVIPVALFGDDADRSTRASAVQKAINKAKELGKSTVFVNSEYFGFDASAVTFDNGVKMVPEGHQGETPNVLGFGAERDGPGGTDDLDAINEAASWADANLFTQVSHPPGTYTVSTDPTFPGSTTPVGDNASYDGSSITIPTAVGTNADELQGETLPSSPSDGEVLRYNGTQWAHVTEEDLIKETENFTSESSPVASGVLALVQSSVAKALKLDTLAVWVYEFINSDTKVVTGDSSTRSTRATAVDSAITEAGNEGRTLCFVPKAFLNYDASAVTFDNSVRMVREGQQADVYDVKAYGAAGDDPGDGTGTDDSEAFKAARDAAVANGGELFVPAGRYNLSTVGFSIDVADAPFRIRGAGKGARRDTVTGLTELIYTGSGSCLDMGQSSGNSEGVEVLGLRVDLTNAQSGASGVRYRRVLGGKIDVAVVSDTGDADHSDMAGIVLDDGGGGSGFTGWVTVVEPQVRGSVFRHGIELNQANANTIIGGSAQQVISGSPTTPSYGLFITNARGNFVFGLDIDGWQHSCLIADQWNQVWIRTENGSMSGSDVFFTSSGIGNLVAGEYDETNVSDNGRQNTLIPRGQIVHPNVADANRPSAGVPGRTVFNPDDGNLNIDNGTDWILPDGTVT